LTGDRGLNAPGDGAVAAAGNGDEKSAGAESTGGVRNESIERGDRD
jgi:hypothetical protein